MEKKLDVHEPSIEAVEVDAESELNIDENGPLAPESLLSALAGGILVDDYLGQSALLLKDMKANGENYNIHYDLRANFDYRSNQAVTDSDALDIEEAFLLAEYEEMTLEDGYIRCKDGSLFVACCTELGREMSGEMFEWWFSQCESITEYSWWHPSDHIYCTWDESFFSVPRNERPLGHYVGHSHIVEEKVGNQLQRLRIQFLSPDRYFDTSKFPSQKVAACLVARVHAEDPPFGEVSVGYLVHIVKQNEDETYTLKSRFWLGNNIFKNPDSGSIMSSWIINSFGNNYWFRLFKLSNKLAEGLYVHCKEEMACLTNFLPHLYETSRNSLSH